MPVSSAPVPIGFSELRACTDAPAIFDLFRRLHYPVDEQSPLPIPLNEQDLPGRLRDNIAARYQIAQIGGVRPGDPLLTVTLLVLKQHNHKSELIRSIAQTWTRGFPGYHLSVFTVHQPDEQGFDQLTFVNARRLGEDATLRIKLHKLIVDRRNPTRHDLETLNRIAMPPKGFSAEKLYEAQCAAFDVERVTDAFFRDYARRFRAAMERIKASNPGLAAFYDATRLKTFTQRLFGRLMFLYFLQKKGALDRNPSFVKDWYEVAVRREENFYRYVLEPLFFDTLNQQRQDHRSPRFGCVPYLNGGLFAPDEDDYVGLVYVPDDLFDTRSQSGLLYFLNTHNFTVEEDTPLELEVALDPEMLGKVFENLLEAEERGQSGTYYTPRPVVNFMCREALMTYLLRETGLNSEMVGWLLDEAETGEPVQDEHQQPRLTSRNLPHAQHRRIERALDQVRVLDPAVGSGAFLLGMLALLVGVRRALYRIAGTQVSPHSQLVEGWKRDFIRDCLYGVDIKREAIEIARLRLWLSLVIDADPFDIEPLPNLDFKLMAGNSLIETFQGITIYPTRPANGQVRQLALIESGTQPLIRRLHALKDEFFQPTGTKTPKELREEILQAERQVVLEALREQRQQNQERMDHLSKSLVNVLPTQTHRAEIETLRHDIEVTDQAIADVRAGKTLPLFLYRLHFARVFEEKDGFDIVIANPPYVRHERVAPDMLRTLRATYPTVQHGMADLYVYFYARALHLLREGGTLAVISSNKFFRAGYGKGLRDLLADQAQVQVILDFGDAPVFDAAAYPCIVITTKGQPASDHIYRGLTAGNKTGLEMVIMAFTHTAQSLAQAQGVQPPASSSAATALVQKLMQMGIPLGRYTNGKMYYGIKTGLNEAFIIDQTTHDRLIAESPRSTEVLKPFLRGRDLDRFTIHQAGLWLIRIENGRTQSAMKVKEKPSEAQAWEYFSKQHPAIAAHLEPFAERARKRDDQGQFWWELRPCVYYQELEEPKIVYPDIAPEAEFCFDVSGTYPDTTAFCISMRVPYLIALLNSSLQDFVLMHLSPAVRGGFYRYKREYVQHLPIVEPSPADQARLAALVDQLQTLGGQGPEAEALEREVDTIVYQTYGLSTEEIAEIERWHGERRVQSGMERLRQSVPAEYGVEL